MRRIAPPSTHAKARDAATLSNPESRKLIENKGLIMAPKTIGPSRQELWDAVGEQLVSGNEGAIQPSPGASTADDQPLVEVRRQWNDWRIATYRVSDVWGLHWSGESGGVRARSPRYFLHGYVLCNGMVGGELAHSCRHGPPPHEIKVCILERGNEKVFARLLELAPKP